MSNVEEQVRPDRDLLNTGFVRRTSFIWLSEDGRAWRFVPPRRVRNLPEADRRAAVVVMRFRHGYYPATIEGAVVRALLESPRTMRLDLLLGYLQKWDDDPWAFFLRAATDKRACLSVVTRMRRDER